MIVLRLTTFIAAPIERCFDLSRSIDLHIKSTAPSGERVVAGITTGLIGSGETVTWNGRHFGFMIAHTSIISSFNRPTYFQDSMLRGLFNSFVHDHHFESQDGGTLMRDEIHFAAPLGPLGWLVERLLLRKHLLRLIERRNQTIKQVAESEDCRKFLPLITS
jgi:ligand-binding SRPBCC domain-containing protein